MDIYTDCKVKIKEQVVSPNFSDLDISGWTGTALKIFSNGTEYFVDIDLDKLTVDIMPTYYKDYCKDNNLNHKRLILSVDKVTKK